MPHGHQSTDESLLIGVTQKLAQHCVGSQTHVTATVHNGEVTLKGTLEDERQRRQIVRTASGVTGVRRVIDQLQIAEKPEGGAI